MKKSFILFCLFLIFFLTGCDSEKPTIIFSKTPFTSQTMYTPANKFAPGERIYFAVYNPKEFKTRLLKLQVFKKESEKSEFWGLEYLYNRTLELNNKKAYTDYVVINNAGFYIFQIFDFTDFQTPVVLGIVKVEPIH
ncbi:MAG: hypothetical protein LUE64_03600 [Candidatus Gastranaerophilales bacterium]|nr:hypothetical protein [Candidatus Gastranaerophilales bacterium]